MTLGDLPSAVGRRFERARFRRWFGVHFAAAVAWFALGTLVGVGLADAITLEEFAGYAAEDDQLLPERITVTFIAVNNLIALGVDVLGFVTVGLASVFMLVVNGVVLGLVVTLGAADTSPLLLAALILPHGVLELSAFFMVAGVVFRVYHRLARYVLGWDDAFLDRQEVFEAAVLVVLAAVMILVAAVLEVHLTPVVAEVLTGEEIHL